MLTQATIERESPSQDNPRSLPVPGIKILVVDDEKTNRMVLKAMLHKDGFDTVMAENGQEAVELFEKERPDLVLMDIMMPLMDGYEATRLIKELAGERYVPVFFLTAMTDENALAKCVECGGDDFLTKPYNRIILKAKIEALLRVRGLYSTLKTQKDELAVHKNYMLSEHEFAKKIFTKIILPDSLDVPNIKYLLSPMAIFNGDLLLVKTKPAGGQHVMLGDFTGHGLPAAIGALPVAEIFYSMTEKGFCISDIVTELNEKLINILPTGIFLASCFIDLNKGNNITVWNGGLPEVIVYSENRGITKRLVSDNLPLGIVENSKLSAATQTVDVEQGDRIYIYSDGVIEAVNQNGEMFGQEKLEASINESLDPSDIFENLTTELDKFRSGMSQEDDITLIELTYEPKLCIDRDGKDSDCKAVVSTEWKIGMELGPDSLKDVDPLPSLIHQLLELQKIYSHRGRIYTILAEMYSNAFEHGVLELDAALKHSMDGFSEFYRLREERIGSLQSGFIKISISNIPFDEGGKLTIKVEDSGSGFDPQKLSQDMADPEKFSGRGVALIRSLCESVSFNDKGNEVEAVYVW